MSDDKEFSVLPTRDGNPTGKSNESRMLAKTGRLGNDGFLKNQRNIIGPEGQKGVVRLKTRGGMPEFTTEFEEADDEREFCPVADRGLVDCYYNAGYIYDPAIYNDGSPIKELVDSDGQKIKANKLVNSPAVLEKFFYTMPSMFSGLMRRVVQIESGKKDGGKFSFLPGWGLAHGLWCAPNGVRWLIEIDGASVYKRKIGFCKKLPANWKAKELEWSSTLSTDKAAKKIAPYWTVTRVGTERTLIGTLPILNGSPFYSWCGWAFSYDGSKACVVLNTARPVGIDYVQWNSLHELTFSSNDKGEPVGVSHAELESGWFNNRNMRDDSFNLQNGGNNGSLQVPELQPGKCRTHSFWSEVEFDGETLTAPVFAYYLEDGGMHVLRFESPYTPNEHSDEGLQYEAIEANKQYIGYRVEFGSYDEVGYPQAVITPEGGLYHTTKLGIQTVRRKINYGVGSFYSALVNKAPKWTEEATDIYVAETYGDAFDAHDVDINAIDSTSRCVEKVGTWWVGDVLTPWHTYVQYPYEHIYQSVQSKLVRNVHTNIEDRKPVFPFAVLHGYDRESYCAGFSDYRFKDTTVNTTNNVGSLTEAVGNVCQNTYGSSTLVTTPASKPGATDNITHTTVGIYDVTSARYPAFTAGTGGDPATPEKASEVRGSTTSTLVIGSQTFSLPSSGFGQYGPDALNFLYFKAARSAFPTNDGAENHVRSPDFQNLHLTTTCGGYVATNITNLFVGVI